MNIQNRSPLRRNKSQ